MLQTQGGLAGGANFKSPSGEGANIALFAWLYDTVTYVPAMNTRNSIRRIARTCLCMSQSRRKHYYTRQ